MVSKYPMTVTAYRSFTVRADGEQLYGKRWSAAWGCINADVTGGHNRAGRSFNAEQAVAPEPGQCRFESCQAGNHLGAAVTAEPGAMGERQLAEFCSSCSKAGELYQELRTHRPVAKDSTGVL